MNNSTLKQKPILKKISEIISAIDPLDKIEEEHINDALKWIASTESIFRIKDDVPNKHLVSGAVLFDEDAQKTLLGNHKQAQLWLPTGGHVEIDEDPKEAASRECLEELGIEADFWTSAPIFLSSTITSSGQIPSHTDVSLWYILKGNHQTQYTFAEEEFNSIKWFTFDEILSLDKKTHPHMKRFIKKIRNMCLEKK